MVFNRKKAEGMAEGILLAIDATKNVEGGSSNPALEENPSARLMLLLRILHQVFTEGKDDSDVFEKSAQLRSILADLALVPLFQALATSCMNTSAEQREIYHAEVKEMIDSWKEYSVFDGPTVWEGYKKAWGRAVTDATNNATKENDGKVGESVTNDSTAAPSPPAAESSTNDAKDVEMGEGAQPNTQSTPSTTKVESLNDSERKSSVVQKSETNQEEGDDATAKKEAGSILPPSSTPTELLPTETTIDKKEESNTNDNDQKQPSPSKKRDSMTSVGSIDIDFDAEGVEEADVEPAKFLEASKVIASLQIARGTFFLYFCIVLFVRICLMLELRERQRQRLREYWGGTTG